MLIDASTYCLVAGPLPPGPAGDAVVGSVSRVTDTPPILSVAEAFAVNAPAVLLLIVSVQVAVFPPPKDTAAPHVVLWLVGAALRVTAMFAVVAGVAPSGACVTVTVNV